MDDLISRKVALEALNEYFVRIGKLKRRGLTSGEKAISLDTAGTIKTLPSAQLERKSGKWEFYEDRAPAWDVAGVKTWARAYKCSECGFVHSVIEDFGQYAFCPNCAADMREAADG